MEEVKHDQSSGNHSMTTVPPNPTEHQPPQTAPSPPRNNKRKASDLDIQDSPYYKIRTLVHELRPHFIEVLRTPDFRNCKAADEIKKQMKVVLHLYQQMAAEEEPIVTGMNAPEPWPRESVLGKESRDGYGEGKQKDVLEKLAEKMMPPPSSLDKKTHDGPILGTYIVGGSVFGWNFITFGGSKPVYYGITKEAYRSCHPKQETVDISTDSAEVSLEKGQIDSAEISVEREPIDTATDPADISAEKESIGVTESEVLKGSDQ